MLWHGHDAVAHHLDPVDRPVSAAKRAQGPGATMIHHETGPRLAAQKLDFIVQPQPTPEFPRPARAFVELVVAVKHGIGLLHDLDRRGLGDADGGTAIGNPVAPGKAAVTAARNLVHHEIPTLFRVMPAKAEVA